MRLDTNIELILGNSNKRFSGVTSTMLQVLEHQKHMMNVAVLGRHHLPGDVKQLKFRELVKLCKTPHPEGKTRIFHARRNDEMLQALFARKLGAKLKIVFTSTAQRRHSGFTRKLMSKMDGIITTCTAAGSYLERPADIMVPHGVDLQRYTPAASKTHAWDRLNLPGEYGIGVFGRVRPSKGIDVIVDAAIQVLPRHPVATVVICGETTPKFQPFLEEQQLKIKKAGLTKQVVVLGKRPFEELPSLYQGMSIVAALSRNEGFGLTPLEAMASGTAVLTSEAGAWLDVVSPGVDGYTTRCGDVGDVVEKLETMLLEPEKLRAMGRSGRTKAEEFYSTQREAQTLCDYFKSLQ